MSHMPLWLGPSLPVTPGPVQHEGHARAVQGDVHQHLVERPVQERRVDREHRVQPGERHPGRARRRVLLGDPDVEDPLGVARREPVQADGDQHRRGDADQVGALPREPQHLVAEHRGPVRAGSAVSGRPVSRVDDAHGVEPVGLVAQGRRVAPALLR